MPISRKRHWPSRELAFQGVQGMLKSTKSRFSARWCQTRHFFCVGWSPISCPGNSFTPGEGFVSTAVLPWTWRCSSTFLSPKASKFLLLRCCLLLLLLPLVLVLVWVWCCCFSYFFLLLVWFLMLYVFFCSGGLFVALAFQQKKHFLRFSRFFVCSWLVSWFCFLHKSKPLTVTCLLSGSCF